MTPDELLELDLLLSRELAKLPGESLEDAAKRIVLETTLTTPEGGTVPADARYKAACVLLSKARPEPWERMAAAAEQFREPGRAGCSEDLR